jgi:hypothetical protein
MLLKHLFLFSSVAAAIPFHLSSRGSIPALDGAAAVMDPGNAEYPRSTNRFPNGTMIGAFTLTTPDDDPVSVLKTVETEDGGRSWSALSEVFRGPRATHDMNNPFPFVLSSGRVLYAFRNHERNRKGGEFTFFRISISYSDDKGVNFQYLCTVDERVANGVNGLWEPFIRYAHDGKTLQIFYSSENNAGDQDSIMRTSNDDGVTWSAPRTISGAGIEARDGMLGIAPIDNDGALIAVFETTENGRFVVGSVTSSDDGATWGNRQLVYTPGAAPLSAGAPQVWNVWGTLVVSFVTNEDRPDSTTGYINCATKIITSIDGGKSWGNKLTVFGDQSNWAGMSLLDPTHFLVMAGVNGKGVLSQSVVLN